MLRPAASLHGEPGLVLPATPPLYPCLALLGPARPCRGVALKSAPLTRARRGDEDQRFREKGASCAEGLLLAGTSGLLGAKLPSPFK